VTGARFAAFVVAAAVVAAGPAWGRSKKPGGAAKAAAPKLPGIPAEKIEALRALLLGDDDAAALEAAAALGASSAPNASELLGEALVAGAPPARAQAELDALAKLAASPAGLADSAYDPIEIYTWHRSPELRKRAVIALSAARSSRAMPIFWDLLGDQVPEVRAAAAEALAAAHDIKARDRLFKLLKRGDEGIAGPLAALATPDQVPQIAELQGTVDDGLLASVLGEYIKRNDVPDKLRVDVLRTISRLGGASATTALVEYVASVPAKDDRPSKREAQKLLDERGSAP
jgi:HEAT repeat protein